MTFRVYRVFEDGKRDLEVEIDDLEEAASFALNLADAISQRPTGNGHGPPKTVEVVRGDQMELSIQILRGGLLPRRGVPKSGSKQ